MIESASFNSNDQTEFLSLLHYFSLIENKSSYISDKPSRPLNLTVSATTRSTASIQWKEPKDDGGSPLKNYLIEKRQEGSERWSRVDKVTADITSYCVQNLIEGNEYYFRVSAENAIGMSEPCEMEKPVKIKNPFGTTNEEVS